MIDARLEALSRRKAALEDALHQEETHAYSDDTKIRNLKQEKLRLKDEMRVLTNEQDQAANTNRKKWH